MPLLTRAREVSNQVFLKATAATFRESWRMVDTLMEISALRPDATIPLTRAEDVVYVHSKLSTDTEYQSWI